MDNRIEWIDIAKGIGIILVVAGHCFYLGYSYPIYAFHMPLFFFLSGLVYNDKKNTQFSSLLKSKARQILKPYVVFYICGLVVSLIVPLWRHLLISKTMLIELYTTNSNNINNSSIWYLICLFVTFLLMYPLHQLMKRFNDRWCLFFLTIVAILSLKIKLFLQWLSPEHIYLIEDRLPFKLDSAIIAVLFMYLGFRYKKIIIEIVEKTNIVWLILSLVLFAVGSYLNGWCNINSLEFGKMPLLYYPTALLGIYATTSFCYLVSKSSFLFRTKNILLFYGINSLVIFGLQSLFIRLYLLVFNKFFHLQMVLYADNPIIHQVSSFLIVTFIISPLVVFTFKELRKWNINLL